MAKRFVQFLEALPNDKLTALAKPAAPGQQRAAYVQLVLDKFGVLGWEKLLERLDTTTLQQMGRELSVGSAEHDDRQYLLKNIPSTVSDKTHETIKTFSTDLLDNMWADLDISGELELEMIILELFIGGIEAIIGIFTIPQMNDVIDAFHIKTQGTSQISLSSSKTPLFGFFARCPFTNSKMPFYVVKFKHRKFVAVYDFLSSK